LIATLQQSREDVRWWRQAGSEEKGGEMYKGGTKGGGVERMTE